MKLTLILPGVIWPDADDAFFHELSLPSLAWLAGKGRHIPEMAGTLDDWLLQAFSLSAPVSAAHAAALLPEPPTAQSGSWLLANPVHLLPNRSELRVADVSQSGITDEEASQLIAALNAHFAEDGLQFFLLSNHQWLLYSRSPVMATFTPFELAIGASMDPILPSGESALQWHRWMNEMQMLMYNHPVNDARDARGQPMIHGVWLSCPGDKAHPIPAGEHPKWWVDTPGWQGLAAVSGLHYDAAPSRSESLLEQGMDGLVRLDTAYWPQTRQDVWGWQEAMRELEDVWFTPLKIALSAGQIAQLDLILPAEDMVRHYVIRPSDRWKFWRREEKISRLCQHHPGR